MPLWFDDARFRTFVAAEARARLHGDCTEFLQILYRTERSYGQCKHYDPRIMYYAYTHMRMSGRSLYGVALKSYDVDLCNLVIRKCTEWDNKARKATLTWMMVAKRLGINRDVARLIGQLVWAGRSTDFT